MENEEENKVVLVGESGVGKTCIINQFVNNKFDENTLSNLSAQYCRKKIEFPGNKFITLDIWDTAGQEKFRSLNRIFYSNSKVVILVYDITDKNSFNEVKNYWYEQIKQNCFKENLIIALVANKCDLYEKKQVPDEEGEEFAKKISALLAFTSAKNDSGINKLFEDIATKILKPDFNFSANEKKKIDKKNNQERNKDKPKNKVKLNPTIKKKKKKCFK